MKKKISMILAVVFIASLFVAISPKVEAYAKSTYDMDYNEVCDYWSSRPEFFQVYYAEVDKAPYIYDIRNDVRKYFVASLIDYVQHPNELAATRPYTYNYMVGVMAQSNPSIYYTIQHGSYAFSLPEKIMDEMNSAAPYLSYEDKAQNVSVLVSFLNSQGVYTVEQYEWWKQQNGGKTAFEVYMHHIKDASDSWEEQIKAQAAAAQQAQEQMIKDAYQAHEEWKQDIMEQAAAAQQAQLDAIAQMWQQ